ncbi:MAG: hypothetical protein BGO53_09690 [Sphingobacteriales bacterium 39-19]|nr:MAG: hypothetical protein BGO53_09690 [Sphingobacteriales bacterium 39-19]
MDLQPLALPVEKPLLHLSEPELLFLIPQWSFHRALFANKMSFLLFSGIKSPCRNRGRTKTNCL